MEMPLKSKRESHLPPLLSLEATGVSIPIGHTEMLLASVYKSPLRAWRDVDNT
jgi:hypothetical protein